MNTKKVRIGFLPFVLWAFFALALSFVSIWSINPLLADSIVGGTEILPKGVRAFLYQHRRFDVQGQYLASGQLGSFGTSMRLTFGDIAEFHPQGAKLLEQLSPKDKQALKDLGLTEVHINPHISLKADIFGFGWGFSDKVMLGFGIPVIEAQVSIRDEYRNLRAGVESMAKGLRSRAQGLSESDQARMKAVAGIMEAIPSIEPGHIQSALVSDYGYKPVGNWSSRNLGDARLFAHINYVEKENYRQGVRVGAILPTGRKKDPDMLMDISFSQEALGAYVESRHDLEVIPQRLKLSGALYYENSLPSKRETRLVSATQPISDQKENLRFQRGQVVEPKLGIGVQIFDGFQLYGQRSWYFKDQDRYHGNESSFNYSYLSEGTKSSSESQLIGVSYSTVGLYHRTGYVPPLTLSFSHQEMTGGRNAEKIDFQFLEVQAYF